MFQDVERILSIKTKPANPLVNQLLAELDKSVVYSESSNIHTNIKLWDNYSREWNKSDDKISKQDWVLEMAANVAMQDDVEVLGDEWSPRKDVKEVIEMFIAPYINKKIVAEIGVGGGRIAREVVKSVSELHCYDISAMMIERARAVVPHQEGLYFHLLNSTNLGGEHVNGYFDFIYSFDVFPHIDLHVMYAYFCETRRLLKPDGKAFFSTSDITSPGGWERFSRQKGQSVGGFCWTSPDAVLQLLKRAGLRVVTRATPREDNVYFRRDLLLLVEIDS